MRIDEYLDFLFKGKKEEANQIRFMTIPDKLVKFIWLDGSMTDEKKYITLKNDEIWFAHKNSLNDPYEYQGMLLDHSSTKACAKIEGEIGDGKEKQ